MYGPGRYVPDLTEGMTTVKDLPAPQLVAYHRDHKQTACRPRPNTRVTSRHFDHLSGKRVVISSSKRPYGLTCSQISGVNALRSASVNRPCQCG